MSNTIIPKNIFQTHKSLEYLKRNPKIVNAMKSWCNHSPQFKYYFYDNVMCDIFMKKNFDYNNINKAYQRLPLGVMKADLWRYCVIYKYGGIYADADTVCKINPNIFINNSYLTIAPEPGHPFFCQWCFAAPPGSPFLKAIIDLSVERILELNKGDHINVHHLTGPAVFTDAINNYLNETKMPTFSDVGQYYKYSSNILSVFNRERFHNTFVKHLYFGSDKDGWKNKAKKLNM